MFRNPTDLKIFIVLLIGTILVISSIEVYYRYKIRPYKLQIQGTNRRMFIQYRWIRKGHLYESLFAILLVGILLLILYKPTQSDKIGDCRAFIFISIMAITLACLAAIGFINTTLIAILENTVRITNQPLPMIGHQPRWVSGITDVYYEKTFSESKADMGWVYTIYVKANNLEPVKILEQVDLKEAADQIESAIKKHLQFIHSHPKE